MVGISPSLKQTHWDLLHTQKCLFNLEYIFETRYIQKSPTKRTTSNEPYPTLLELVDEPTNLLLKYTISSLRCHPIIIW
jgi:hypothetical protein